MLALPGVALLSKTPLKRASIAHKSVQPEIWGLGELKPPPYCLRGF